MHRQGLVLAVPGRGWGLLFLPAHRGLHGPGKSIALEKESCSPARARGPLLRPCGSRLSLGLLGAPGGPPISRVFTFGPTWGNCWAPTPSGGVAGLDRGGPSEGEPFLALPHTPERCLSGSLCLPLTFPAPMTSSTPLQRRDPADKPPWQPGCCAQQAA